MKDQIFEVLLELIETLSGIAPPESHYNHIRRELEKYLKLKEIRDGDLPALAEKDADFRQILMNAATINETYFFREARQFEVLRDLVLPDLFNQRKKTVLWSVSCSTGEEAVSLAVLSQKESEKSNAYDFHIYASDINTEVLAQFRTGRFGKHSFRRDGTAFHDLLKEFAVPCPGNTGGIQIERRLMEKISCSQANLFDSSFDFLPSSVDLIFFRNTLLYTALEKRSLLVKELARKLSPGGYFFLASSEVPFVDLPELELIENQGVYYFRKMTEIPDQKAHVQPAGMDRAPSPAPLPVRDEERTQQEERLLRILSSCETESTKVPEFYYPLAEEIKNLLRRLNDSDFVRVESSLIELKKDWGSFALILYLEGRLNSLTGKEAQARSLFRRALGLSEDFWPARYYFAMGLKEINPRAARDEFILCLASLERENQKGRNLYAFLMEDFDPAYFQHMCRKWIEKLGNPLRVIK